MQSISIGPVRGQYQRTKNLDNLVLADLQQHISYSIHECALRRLKLAVSTVRRSVLRLASAGLVERVVVDAQTYDERHSYRLTQAGRRYLRALVEKALPVARQIELRAERKLGFMAKALERRIFKAGRDAVQATSAYIASYESELQTFRGFASRKDAPSAPSTAAAPRMKTGANQCFMGFQSNATDGVRPVGRKAGLQGEGYLDRKERSGSPWLARSLDILRGRGGGHSPA